MEIRMKRGDVFIPVGTIVGALVGYDEGMETVKVYVAADEAKVLVQSGW